MKNNLEITRNVPEGDDILNSEKNKGIMFIILAAFFFSLMTVFIRLGGELPTMQKVLFRNLVASVIAFIMVKKEKASLKVGKENLLYLFLRAAGGTVGMICNFYAIDHLNISDANMLNKLSPFFAILMSIFILKEKPHRMEWLSVVVAFIGALFVIQPGFSLTSGPAFIGLLGGFGAGFAYTFVRKLGLNGIHGSIIVLFFSVFSLLVTLPAFIVEYTPMTIRQFICLMLAGTAACGGQFSITAAYSHAPAKEISVFDYTQVIFAAIWGFLLFNQIPNIFSFIGYIVILAATLIKFFHNKSKNNLQEV